MNNKYELENILTLTKSLINLYINATIESSNEKVHLIMLDLLNDTLNLQRELYCYMEEINIYKVNNLSEKEINKTYKKLKESL